MDFLSETMKARKEQSEIFKELKEKNLPTQNSVSSEISFQELRANKDFLKQQPREFIASRPALQEMLRNTLQEGRK